MIKVPFFSLDNEKFTLTFPEYLNFKRAFYTPLCSITTVTYLPSISQPGQTYCAMALLCLRLTR